MPLYAFSFGTSLLFSLRAYTAIAVVGMPLELFWTVPVPPRSYQFPLHPAAHKRERFPTPSLGWTLKQIRQRQAARPRTSQRAGPKIVSSTKLLHLQFVPLT